MPGEAAAETAANEFLYAFDLERRRRGYALLAGVDEAGRGPLAGPVAAAAVVLPADIRWPALNDSKKLSPETREKLYDAITKESLFFAVALVPPDVIDEINILRATFLAMAQAVGGLSQTPALILVDGNQHVPQIPRRLQETVVRGDAKSASIAAASVVAKVTRDRWMADAHKKFPHYGFNTNMGYGTEDHCEALRKHGPCPIHRRSFAPVRERLALELPFR